MDLKRGKCKGKYQNEIMQLLKQLFVKNTLINFKHNFFTNSEQDCALIFEYNF